MVRNGKRLKAWASRTAKKAAKGAVSRLEREAAVAEERRRQRAERKRELKGIYEEAYQREKGMQEVARARRKAKAEARGGKWTMRARTIANIGSTLSAYDPIGFPKARKGTDELGLGGLGLGIGAPAARKRKKRRTKRKVKRTRKKKR